MYCGGGGTPTPVPLSASDPFTLPAKFKVALNVPDSVGAKVISTLQFEPGDNDAEQLLVCVKLASPETETSVNVRGEPPVEII